MVPGSHLPRHPSLGTSLWAMDFLQLLFIALPCKQRAKDHSEPGDPLVRKGRCKFIWECSDSPTHSGSGRVFACVSCFSLCVHLYLNVFLQSWGFKRVKKQSALDEFGTSTTCGCCTGRWVWAGSGLAERSWGLPRKSLMLRILASRCLGYRDRFRLTRGK